MFIRRALLPLVQSLLAALLVDRWLGPPLKRNTAGAAPATFEVTTLKIDGTGAVTTALNVAILPSMLTNPPLGPKMIWRGLVGPARVCPAPEVNRSSA